MHIPNLITLPDDEMLYWRMSNSSANILFGTDTFFGLVEVIDYFNSSILCDEDYFLNYKKVTYGIIINIVGIFYLMRGTLIQQLTKDFINDLKETSRIIMTPAGDISIDWSK